MAGTLDQAHQDARRERLQANELIAIEELAGARVEEPDGSGRPLVVRPGHDWDPAFSPDGSTLVWMATTSGGDHDLYVMDLAGGEPRRLTSGVGMEAYADWDPDGGKLVYLARRDGHNDIYEMAPDGSGSRRLTDDPADDNGPRISPDGRQIAFFSNRDGDFEIYVMNRDGTAQRRITSSPSRDMYPTWSPDGAWIAFESDRSGTTQVYRIRPDGTDLRQLTGPQALDSCASEIARQFDFWIGEWTVTQEIATQEGGWETYQARSTVAPALDGWTAEIRPSERRGSAASTPVKARFSGTRPRGHRRVSASST